MDTDKLLEESKGDASHDAYLSFRLSQEDKDKLLDLCNEHGLSMGKLLRGLIKEFMDNV